MVPAGPIPSVTEAAGALAVITSDWFFREVVWLSATDETRYRPKHIRVKETDAVGWICLPDDPYADARGWTLARSSMMTRRCPARPPRSSSSNARQPCW